VVAGPKFEVFSNHFDASEKAAEVGHDVIVN
jgi:hypothetical protein